MLGTAVWVGFDLLVLWQYAQGSGWVRYVHSKTSTRRRKAFLPVSTLRRWLDVPLRADYRPRH